MLTNIKHNPKWSICKQRLKDTHQQTFNLANWTVNEKQSKEPTNQSKNPKHVKHLKYGHTWTICKHSLTDTYKHKCHVESKRIYKIRWISSNISNMLKGLKHTCPKWSTCKHALKKSINGNHMLRSENKIMKGNQKT